MNSEPNNVSKIHQDKISKLEDIVSDQRDKIYDLELKLVNGLHAQENLLREMVDELKKANESTRAQQEEIKEQQLKMKSFTRGAIWIGGVVTAVVGFAVKIWTGWGS